MCEKMGGLEYSELIEVGNILHIKKIYTKKGDNNPVTINDKIILNSNGIYFEKGGFISEVLNIFFKNNKFYLETKNSIYKVLKTKNQVLEEKSKNINEIIKILGLKSIDYKNVKKVITAKGSSYKYLDNGKTQRFKLVEGKKYEEQDILVYAYFRDSNIGQLFLKFLQNPNPTPDISRGVWIINEKGDRIDNFEQANNSKQLYLIAFNKTSNEIKGVVPATINPTIGFKTFDQRRFKINGIEKRALHIGNKVVEIIEK